MVMTAENTPCCPDDAPGSSCTTPMFVSVCAAGPGPQVEISDLALGCALDAAGNAIGVVVLSRQINETTGVETQVRVMFPYSGGAAVSPYTGAFGDCGEAAVSSVAGCFNGSQSVVLHYVHPSPGAAPSVLVTNGFGAIVPGANAGNTNVGVCVVPDPVPTPVQEKIFAGGVNIASGTASATHDPDGNGPSWSWGASAGANLQSLTVTALISGTPASANPVLVRFGATGRRVFIAQGQTISFSVAQDHSLVSEVLESDIRVDCNGNSAATVIWTEQ